MTSYMGNQQGMPRGRVVLQLCVGDYGDELQSSCELGFAGPPFWTHFDTAATMQQLMWQPCFGCHMVQVDAGMTSFAIGCRLFDQVLERKAVQGNCSRHMFPEAPGCPELDCLVQVLSHLTV